MARNTFDNDGLKGIKNYFQFNFFASILAIIAIIMILLGTVFVYLAVVGIVILIPAIVLGVLATLGLMFGIRDLRRGTLPSAPSIAGVSRLLKWLVVATAVVLALFYLVLILVTLSEFSAYSTGNYNSYLGTVTAVSIAFTIVLLIIGILFAYQLMRFYKMLAKGLSQPRLNTAAMLLVFGIVISAVAAIIALLASGTASSTSVTGGLTAAATGLGIISLVLDLIVIVIITVSYYLGYAALKSAAPK